MEILSETSQCDQQTDPTQYQETEETRRQRTGSGGARYFPFSRNIGSDEEVSAPKEVAEVSDRGGQVRAGGEEAGAEAGGQS